jgi:hypothetical protein
MNSLPSTVRDISHQKVQGYVGNPEILRNSHYNCNHSNCKSNHNKNISARRVLEMQANHQKAPKHPIFQESPKVDAALVSQGHI